MRLRALILLASLACPAWAATKMTVEQLRSTIATLRNQGKSDEAMAAQLKEIVLTEELSHTAERSLLQYMAGDISTEQLFILQGRSAFLPPALADQLTGPAPDAATQKQLLDSALQYAAKTYGQAPAATATRTTARFQQDSINTSILPEYVNSTPYPYARMSEAVEEEVLLDHGTEKVLNAKRVSWGENGQISNPGPLPPLAALLQEAVTGNATFDRWQTVSGHKAAVFTFVVDRKKSHYRVSYCCFPKTSTATAVAAPGTLAPALGDIQSVTTWVGYKKDVGYRGTLFLDAETGAVLRILTFADLKPTDFVHQEAVRVDYSPVQLNGEQHMLPLASFTVAEVVPGGASDARSYTVRHMLYSVTYTQYTTASKDK